VGDLLDVGGHLVATTIDARVVVEKIMNLGLDLSRLDTLEEQVGGDDPSIIVKVGKGVCQLKFQPDTIRRLFTYEDDDHFGLQYTFTLVEGDDHSAGVGDAVNLPEWLTPLSVLTELAKEAGLELTSCDNFHEFYEKRKVPNDHWAAHRALYNMHVLNQHGGISKDEWEVSRMYVAIKFTKVTEGNMVLEDDEDSAFNGEDDDEEDFWEEEAYDDDEDEEDEPKFVDPKKLPIAMMKAKRVAGEIWATLSSEEKMKRSHAELAKM